MNGVNRRLRSLVTYMSAHRHCLLFVLAAATCTFTGCSAGSAGYPSIRFSDLQAIYCVLHQDSRAERTATVRTFLIYLDSAPDIDAAGALESGLISITVVLGGTDKWVVDYMLVWPGGNDGKEIKLVNIGAAVADATVTLDPVSARNARDKAYQRLSSLIKQLTSPNGPLAPQTTLLSFINR